VIRFIAALVVAIIGWGGVVVTQRYKALSKRQLAQMVYDLDKAITDAAQGPSALLRQDVRERAQKMINRARLEGLL